MGMWYEFARLPFMFEKTCGSSSARYIYDDVLQGALVLNICYSDTNFQNVSKWDQGFAHQLPEKTGSGDLLVKFAGQGDREGDYIVYETDYLSYSIVGSVDKNMLWILTRDKQISRKMATALLERAQQFGFDLRFLIRNDGMIF
jgi:apolipoprotein D and lipocalin family protein